MKFFIRRIEFVKFHGVYQIRTNHRIGKQIKFIVADTENRGTANQFSGMITDDDFRFAPAFSSITGKFSPDGGKSVKFIFRAIIPGTEDDPMPDDDRIFMLKSVFFKMQKMRIIVSLALQKKE